MRLGVLDIGSNTVHLLLVDAYPGARPVPYASHKRPLSLVRYLNEYGAITEEGQNELISFISEAAEFASSHRVEDFMAFCTSAIRESSNGHAVLERVKHETGVTLMELSGEEEAGMTFYSVRRWFGWSSESILNLDMGGGSLELALGTDEFPQVAFSVPLGAGRLTREWLPNDLPGIKEVRELRNYVRDVLTDPTTELRQYGKPTPHHGCRPEHRGALRQTRAAPRCAEDLDQSPDRHELGRTRRTAGRLGDPRAAAAGRRDRGPRGHERAEAENRAHLPLGPA